MFIRLHEIGDLTLQLVVVLTMAAGGIAIASYAAQSAQKKGPELDVNRASIWTAEPTRIDPTMQAYLREEPVLPVHLATAEDAICSDAIGLRLSCDLVGGGTGSAF